MIHIVCYLREGDPSREGRQLWSSACPPFTALGLTCWPACLSVWSSGSRPPLIVPVASLFIMLLSSTFLLSPPHVSPTFLSSHPSRSPYSSSCYPVPPSSSSSSSSPESGSALNFSSQATCCLLEPKNAATRGTDRGPGFWHKERNKGIKKSQHKDG